jgi:hypothetical protein
MITDIGKLRDEHDEILKIVSRLRFLVDQPKPPPRLHLFALRYQLTSILIGHLKDEDWLLYPRLLSSADAQIAGTARSFIKELGGLATAYIAHCDKWNADAIGADWPGYCSDSRGLINALTNRIQREDRELYPLLVRLDRAA